jgi:hypothetical protein
LTKTMKFSTLREKMELKKRERKFFVVDKLTIAERKSNKMLESKAAALKLAKGDHDGVELVALEGLLKTNGVTFLNY